MHFMNRMVFLKKNLLYTSSNWNVHEQIATNWSCKSDHYTSVGKVEPQMSLLNARHQDTSKMSYSACVLWRKQPKSGVLYVTNAQGADHSVLENIVISTLLSLVSFEELTSSMITNCLIDTIWTVPFFLYICSEFSHSFIKSPFMNYYK